ncbi:cytochrome c oxidase assembly protein COX19-like isoform X2 [Canis lupus familiaris]|uniref:cytochrome c oxidase assembly protein COX19-like isoform X2 n=1 Tax=Canis lupus familiaris TaxID=9615 RepID=UPI0018F3E7E8|nr:cytochrome c oxidase assembly protein COX19-like isoform X2 [Canis lupus familiaris]
MACIPPYAGKNPNAYQQGNGWGRANRSTAMNFGSKTCQPRPPDKGSFPLDHFGASGECKSFKEKFMKCLRDNKFENALCRKESKAYLECRMEGIPGRQLMAQEPLEKLGFGDLTDGKPKAETNS